MFLSADVFIVTYIFFLINLSLFLSLFKGWDSSAADDFIMGQFVYEHFLIG